MGHAISKNCRAAAKQGFDLVDVAVECPELIDNLDSYSLRALARTSRYLRMVVDQPAVWKNQFSKEIGVEPSSLPHPGVTTFKELSQGIDVVFYRAEHPNERLHLDQYNALLVRLVDEYLERNFRELQSNLAAQANAHELARIAMRRGLENAAVYGVMTGITGAGVGMSVYTLSNMSAIFAAPTGKLATIIGSIGMTGAKVYFCCVFGLGGAAFLGAAGFAGYLTATEIQKMIRTQKEHKRHLQDLRVRARINAARNPVNAHI